MFLCKYIFKMSGILYVIDGFLSSEDKVEVTKDLITQLRDMDPKREIMLINKFPNSWGLESLVDYYREYLDGFMVGYPPTDIIESKQYDKPYVYFATDNLTLENWMPYQGVSDHVANVYNGFIFASKEAYKLDYERVFRIEYDMLFHEDDIKVILKDLDNFENEEFLIYGKRQEGQWAPQHQSLIDLHFCGYSYRMIDGFNFVKNDEEFWALCSKIGYYGKWAEYVMSMVFESNKNKNAQGTIYNGFSRHRFLNSKFDRLSSSGIWTDKWKHIPKICKLDNNNGHKTVEDKIAIFYLNMDYNFVEIDCISNKNYYKNVKLTKGSWCYDIVDRQPNMVFMSKMTFDSKTETNIMTVTDDESFNKLNCRLIQK